MKAMMIIPIFISHMGCRNDCVFCNQHHINGHGNVPSREEVRETIEGYLESGRAMRNAVAFYGGSFTGIEPALQELYLSIALEYKRQGRIQEIRLSTRPDYIDEPTVKRLKAYEVDLVELGVQSFDETVLKASGRGHTARAIYDAIECLKNDEIEFGIQLMLGLPGDTRDRFFFSVEETIRLKPKTLRLYPTLVLKETSLAKSYADGLYMPMTLEDAVLYVKDAVKMLWFTKIERIRIGLQATDLITFDEAVLAGPFHPAFRDLVMDALMYDALSRIGEHLRGQVVDIEIPRRYISNVRGHHHSNAKKLKAQFGVTIASVSENETYGDEVFIVEAMAGRFKVPFVK